jgi:hypothetical protein
VGIFVFWKWALAVVPRIRGPQRGLIAAVTMAIGMAAVVAMSSWLNAAALAGPAALEHHFSQALQAYEEALDEAQRKVLAANKLMPEIRADAARFEALSEAETRGEGPTGLSGDGAVTLMLRQVSQRLDLLADDLEESLSQADDVRFEAASLIGEMRQVLASRMPVNERRHVFEQLSVEMDAALADLLATDRHEMVERTAQYMEKEIVRPATVTDRLVADKQKAAMASITAAIAETRTKLLHTARRLAREKDVVPPSYEPLNAVTAVFTYASDFVPSWAGAVAIDVLPGVVLLFCVVAVSIIREEEGEPSDRAADVTLRDLKRAGEVLVLLGQYNKTKEEADERSRVA